MQLLLEQVLTIGLGSKTLQRLVEVQVAETSSETRFAVSVASHFAVKMIPQHCLVGARTGNQP